MAVFAANVIGVSFFKVERDSILVIDPHATRTRAIALQRFQPISWWPAQRLKVSSRVDPVHLSPRQRPKQLWKHSPRRLAVGADVNVAGAFIGKGLNHASPLRYTTYGNP